MRHTCVAVKTKTGIIFMPSCYPSVEGEVCGAPAVDFQELWSGVKEWLCAEHWDEIPRR